MSRLFDTDICIFWLRANPQVRSRFAQLNQEEVAISVITAAELLFGAYNSRRSEELNRTETFIGQCDVRPLTTGIIHLFGEWKTALRAQGEQLEDFDLLIACTALSEGRILVTNNERHYRRIPELHLDNWYAAP